MKLISLMKYKIKRLLVPRAVNHRYCTMKNMPYYIDLSKWGSVNLLPRSLTIAVRSTLCREDAYINEVNK